MLSQLPTEMRDKDAVVKEFYNNYKEKYASEVTEIKKVNI